MLVDVKNTAVVNDAIVLCLVGYGKKAATDKFT